MSNWQDQLTNDADSSYSGTTFQSNDPDAVDVTFSDYESEYIPSETSSDRAFIAPDTDTLSYISDKPSEEGNCCSLQPSSPGRKKPVKTISKRTIYCNGQQETQFLVLWYSWEKEEIFE
ncbi:hypothetical protein PENARI_c047G00943 [Penicillium arizonense]|uniref:Uncharacterized protein n=1 Tax=Penicillium arizonense TaxID=1835702 RepID=A0A1F5L2U8_PENAI|nr:hypothetical protein PENARI_c047G00943 [Penicillium arizonense]OGE47377.1 hypothetical protein PENARI_c047G00943 [Penicillium arizonense]